MITAHWAPVIKAASAWALHNDTYVGHDPKLAQVVAHVADFQAHWELGPISALWATSGDASSVEKEAGEIYKTISSTSPLNPLKCYCQTVGTYPTFGRRGQIYSLQRRFHQSPLQPFSHAPALEPNHWCHRWLVRFSVRKEEASMMRRRDQWVNEVNIA